MVETCNYGSRKLDRVEERGKNPHRFMACNPILHDSYRQPPRQMWILTLRRTTSVDVAKHASIVQWPRANEARCCANAADKVAIYALVNDSLKTQIALVSSVQKAYAVVGKAREYVPAQRLFLPLGCPKTSIIQQPSPQVERRHKSEFWVSCSLIWRVALP